MDGAHSQIQGWTHLPPHPRPLILECPPTLGNPTHNGFHSALQCTMDKTSWVYPTSPLCKIHMSDVQFHMPIMQFMKTIILECAEYRPLCPFHYSAYSIIHNQYHSSLVSLRVAWEKGTSFPGETISVGEFFFVECLAKKFKWQCCSNQTFFI
jgi:hypothetical protein